MTGTAPPTETISQAPRRRVRAFPAPEIPRNRQTTPSVAMAKPQSPANVNAVPMTTPANASAIESKSNVRGAAFVVILTTLALFGGYRLMLHLETIRAVKTAPLAVSFDEPGMIADVLARDGEFVRAGQPLLAIADEVMPEQIDALNTELRLARAEVATSAATSRWAVSSDLAVADQLDNRVEHLESRLAEIRSKTPIHFLTAPVAGRVLRVHRFTGERISRGEILVDIVPEN